MSHIADIPHIDCWVRKEYLYNLESHHGEFEKGVAFGIRSIQGQALLFCVMMDNGAQVWNLPISALITKKDAPDIPLDYLQLWGMLGYDVSVHEFGFLSGARCRVVLKDRTTHDGTYLFTLDNFGSQYSETYGELGHKSFTIIELDSGCLVAQPNNRVLWANPSFIAKPFSIVPDYTINTHIWNPETLGRWVTEDSNKFFYQIIISEEDADDGRSG